MQIEMIKTAGGVFAPAFEHDLPRLTKFQNGEMYTAEFKLTRNPAFHRKMFAFFNFCFQHWAAFSTGLLTGQGLSMPTKPLSSIGSGKT